MSDAVWFPSPSFMQQTRLYCWMQKLGFDNYEAFYQKSIKDPAWFWDEAVKEIGIAWHEPYKEALNLSKGIQYPDFFAGGRMNIYTNAVEKWAQDASSREETAVIWSSDDGSRILYSFAELMEKTEQAAAEFVQAGVRQGDVVTLYLPMIPETLISMLALAKIGAIFSPAFSGYGAEAVAARANAAGSRFIITADGYYRRGKIIPMKEECDRAVGQCPSIAHVIVVKRTGRDIPWTDGRDIKWDALTRPAPAVSTVQTAASDPLMILYTSGTTGKPKGALHTHAGFPLKAAFDAGICMDVRKGDTFFWYTDMGWMMGPFLVFGGLVNGAAILLFEGTPDYPSPERLFEICQEFNVTHLGLSPTLVRSQMKYPDSRAADIALPAMRVMASSGEPWNPEPWMWLFETIGKRRIPIVNYSGGTEISGGILGNVLVKPISPVTFNSPLPGMAAHVFDETGKDVFQQVGELVLTKPWAGMTKGFWKDNGRYEETYWSRWPDTWVHGDWAVREENGFWTITGRSDDILNTAGKRLGPAEMESILVQHPEVAEAACIGIPDAVKGEAPICFAVLVKNAQPDNEIAVSLYHLVEKQLGKALKPKTIHFVKALPKTRNGKTMRRVIKAAYLHKHTGDLSALENPECLEEIQSCSPLFESDSSSSKG